jgi:acetyltransferase
MNSQMIFKTFHSGSGFQVGVRYLHPDDAPFLVDLFEHMSEESRYRRFNQALERVPVDRMWAEAEAIAHAVVVNSTGLIAFVDLPDQLNAPVAAARYVLIDDEEAEMAISVRDDMHNQGIGTQMMILLVEEAKAEGLQRLVGSVQNDNKAVWGLLKHIDATIEHILEGTTTQIIIHLQPVEQDQLVVSV